MLLQTATERRSSQAGKAANVRTVNAIRHSGQYLDRTRVGRSAPRHGCRGPPAAATRAFPGPELPLRCGEASPKRPRDPPPSTQSPAEFPSVILRTLTPSVQQRDRELQRHILRHEVLWQRGIAAPVGDEGAVMAGLEPHRRAVAGMPAELAQHPVRPPGPALPDLLVRDQRHRPVDPDAKHVAVRDRGIGPGMAHPGAVAADAGEDRLAGLRMRPDPPGQRQQPEREARDRPRPVRPAAAATCAPVSPCRRARRAGRTS